MNNIGELLQERFTKVGVMRPSFPVARYFFDVHVSEDGIAGYFMWARNTIRFPIIHHIRDMLVRRKRASQPREEIVSNDDRHFFVPFEEIQGLVTYTKHKEIQMLTAQERIYFYFRDKEDYKEFTEILEDKVPDKYFTRDDAKSPDGVYVS